MASIPESRRAKVPERSFCACGGLPRGVKWLSSVTSVRHVDPYQEVSDIEIQQFCCGVGLLEKLKAKGFFSQGLADVSESPVAQPARV